METPLESNGPARGHAEGSKQTQFQPGHPGSKKGGGRKPRQTSMLLQAMQWAFCQPESKDKTDGQRACRQMLKEDPTTFIQTLMTLQKEQAAAEAKAATRPNSAQPGGAEPPRQPTEPPKPRVSVETDPNQPPNCVSCKRRIRVGQQMLPRCPDCKALASGWQKPAPAEPSALPPPDTGPEFLKPLCSRCSKAGYRVDGCKICREIETGVPCP